MSINEENVAAHYSTGNLRDRILKALESDGVELKNLKADDLKGLEEFHIGEREATIYTTQKMMLKPKQRVLDIGCGIGGAARYMVNKFGVHVTGIDLTPEYINVAGVINHWLGLEMNPYFKCESAIDLPFEDGSFDAAITMHVAMNIKDRPKLYGEAARVLKPGSIFAVYDVMKTGDEPVVYPVPWAASSETSHLTSLDEMKALLADAGFEVLEIEDRTEFGIEFFKKAVAAAKANDGNKPGAHIIMGKPGAERLKNVMANMLEGRIAPIEIIARRSTPTTPRK